MASIGIDFGTTNSLIVAYDKKKNEFNYFNYSDSDGMPVPTSSTVWYHDNVVEVGEVARENINKLGDVEGHHFERSIKLKLGTAQHLNVFGKPTAPFEIAGTIISDYDAAQIITDLARKNGSTDDTTVIILRR